MLGRCQGGAGWETSQELGLVEGTEDLGQSLGYRVGGPIDGHIHPPLPRSHLSALLNCSHSDGLTFFFITTLSPQGLCTCRSSCTRSFSLHVQMAPCLASFWSLLSCQRTGGLP